MTLNLDDFKHRFQVRADAVKKRSVPPVGGDDRLAFVKQAEVDFQDFMIIADCNFSVEDGYLVLRYKLDS